VQEAGGVTKFMGDHGVDSPLTDDRGRWRPLVMLCIHIDLC